MKTTKHLALHLNIALLGIVCLTLASCKTVNIEASSKAGYVALPIFPGWVDKHLIHYITTDVNDQAVAKEIGVNYVSRFNEVLPAAGRMPSTHNAVERIYAVTNFKQAKVLPSAPYPIGGNSSDTAYSPIWRMYNVTWVEGTSPYELQSEEEILQAEDKKLVKILATSLIVNCAVIDDKSGNVLPSARLIRKP
ncbi:DUF7482 domain-containing protein [Methyloradius palustris]|uniref:DUF7482 domain-containing protein n=1 Tax=Methyloradius palustris TaxID=2778876 RepID=A0A8D5JXE0_9PROT|nr:hypothetical protein [Methyloradius palustris]BCM26039.1 hypothetical protein ZMTM_22980 [Methyloradius palustris]